MWLEVYAKPSLLLTATFGFAVCVSLTPSISMTRTSKQLLALFSFATALSATAQTTTVLDDFSGSLSGWSTIRILNNGTAAFNNSVLTASGGALSLVTTTYDNVEQAAHIFANRSLAVGEELQISVSGDVTGSQDVGLYVGIAPTEAAVVGSTRASYVAVYKRNNEQIYSRGFGGTAEFGLVGGVTVSDPVKLFVSRTAADTYDVGYYDVLNARTVLATRVDASNTAAAIGLYTDVRATGTLGSVDNFAIYNATAIPEPASFAAIFGLGALGFAGSRRRRSS